MHLPLRSALPLLLLATGVSAQRAPSPPPISTRTVPVLQQGTLRFRDLNRDGALAPYEDWRLTPAERARDLVSRMSLAEKAGAMMHGTLRSVGQMGGAGVGERYDSAANVALIHTHHVTSGITRLGGTPDQLATQNNMIQAIAEQGRLGIPVTISTDPRHHFQFVLGASVTAGQFSQWPETLGFAALGDTALMRRFGDVARQEYRAVGIHMALSPQADLATEPRWSRINGTFGEDARLTGRLVRAYVEGFQHGSRGTARDGVLAIVKHWVGYGAAVDGFDGHNHYGRYARLDATTLDLHAQPFVPAFRAGVAGVMPTYSILQDATWGGQAVEQVGAGFNRYLLTDMLRGRFGFRGLIVSDWLITNDCGPLCVNGVPAGERPSFAHVAMPWGVESLPIRTRFVKAVLAGIDQFGGVESSELLVDAVKGGELTETRLNESALRVMEQKFRLGLFENPFVDAEAAARIAGSPAFRARALDAQRSSVVLLENRKAILPARRARRVYLHGVDSAAATARGWTVVADPAKADLAIMRLSAPFETLHPGYVFGAMQHEGSLAYRAGDPDFDAFTRVSALVPTVVSVYLDRPAILTPLRDRAAAALVNFGISDEALLDVIAGRGAPRGRLPFELPSSMAAVAAQRPDRPFDSASPLYRFGYGLRY